MMPSCTCFARRVKRLFGIYEAIAAQVLVPAGFGYGAWGCFSRMGMPACRAVDPVFSKGVLPVTDDEKPV
jgi:hypothetical protein